MVYNQLLDDFCRNSNGCRAYSVFYLFAVAAFASWGVISAVALGFYIGMRTWRRNIRRSRVDPMTRLDAACDEMRHEIARRVDNAQVVKGLECLVNTEPNPADPSDCGYCDNTCECTDETSGETRSENPIQEALSKPAATVSVAIDQLPPVAVQTFAVPQPVIETSVASSPITRADAHIMANQEGFARMDYQTWKNSTQARKKSAEEALANNPLFRLVSKNLEISRCQRVNGGVGIQQLTAERDQAVLELPFAPRTQAPVKINETINELTRLQLQIENTVDEETLKQLRNRRDELRAELRASKKRQLDELA